MLNAVSSKTKAAFVSATDAVLFTGSYFISFALANGLGFDGAGSPEMLVAPLTFVVAKTVVFHSMRLYDTIWAFTGMVDLRRSVKANFFATVALIVISFFWRVSELAVIIIDFTISVVLICGYRIAIRLSIAAYKQRRDKNMMGMPIPAKKRAFIIGAGIAGEKIIREIRDNPSFHFEVVGLLDDNANKLNRIIHGYRVIGTISELISIKDRYRIEVAILAIPSATGKQVRRVIDLCKKAVVDVLSVPPIEDIIAQKAPLLRLRNVTFEDLLGRSQVDLNIQTVDTFLKGRKILVTGAGGSIGSELCRQICRFKPSDLALIDNCENNLFYAELALKKEFPEQSLKPILADVKDEHRLSDIFSALKPNYVFHAAAYKHVPIIEANAWEAVTNNIIGTRNVLRASIQHSVERFLLVSTDKAVRPCNVMGASKRIAEMLSQSYAGTQDGTTISIVRFGNVIGSNGSVIPHFKRQIEEGGPVTVTHPEITRYFMTIPEACQLILQAGTMGSGGEIFILEMGKPVKIINMAKDLIRLSGLEPDVDIKIEFVGLRPGEKLYEELITDGEGIVKTSHEKILVLKGAHSESNRLNQQVDELAELAKGYDGEKIRSKIKEIMLEYIY